MRAFVSRGLVIAAFCLAGLAGAGHSAHAATIDAAGATQLRQVVDDALGFYLDSHAATGEGLTLSGPVEVTPKANYYEVKIPGAAMTSSEGVMQLGTIMMNVTPGNGGTYRTSIAVPNQITLKDKAGSERMRLALGRQKFSGIWDPALALFTHADAAYGDVTATITPDSATAKGDAAQPVTITLGNIASKIAMRPDGAAAWSGPQTTTIDNVALAFGSAAANRLSIEKMQANVSYKKIDLGASKKLRDQLRARMTGDGKLSPEALRDIVASTLGSLQGVPEGADSTFTLTNLALDLPTAKDATGAVTPISLRLANLTSTSAVDGVKTDAGTGTFNGKLTGLTLTGHNGPLTGLLPSEAAFTIAAAKIPFKEIIASLTTAVDSALAAQTGVDAQSDAAKAQAALHMQQGIASLPALLAKAGTTITISDTMTKAPDLASTLSGALTATTGAPYIFAGKMTLVLGGMDELIVKLQNLARTANNPKAAGYAQMLILMQLSGQLGQTPEGKSQRTYALELAADGKVLLNGVDMQAMIPQSQGSTPAPAPTPAPTTP